MTYGRLDEDWQPITQHKPQHLLFLRVFKFTTHSFYCYSTLVFTLSLRSTTFAFSLGSLGRPRWLPLFLLNFVHSLRSLFLVILSLVRSVSEQGGCMGWVRMWPMLEHLLRGCSLNFGRLSKLVPSTYIRYFVRSSSACVPHFAIAAAVLTFPAASTILALPHRHKGVSLPTPLRFPTGPGAPPEPNGASHRAASARKVVIHSTRHHLRSPLFQKSFSRDFFSPYASSTFRIP